MKSTPELSPKDRAAAVDIKVAHMYNFQMKHKLTGEVMSHENFMVIHAANGRKYVFREVLETKPKSKIIT